MRLAATALGVAASGALLAIMMPRGPVTSGQGLTALVVGIATGLFAGFVMRSRWGYAVAPIVHALAFELARVGSSGPTVDAPRFDSAFAVLAFVLGRLGYVLLASLPLVLGVAWGRRARRRVTRAAEGERVRPGRAAVVVLASVAVVALAVAVAWPGSTPPLATAEGASPSGGVATLARVPLGGGDQGIMIRGHDVDDPVLLYLSGGPGQSDLPYTRVLLGDLERDFVVVAWDQRGAGTSYAALEPTSTHTLDGIVADTIALAEYLRERFGESRIYLLGESWGSLLGVLAVRERPDLFHAFVGSGQMVDVTRTDRRIWRDLLAYADRTGDQGLRDTLLAYGEPPYRDVPWANTFVMARYEALTPAYEPPAAYLRRGQAAGLGPWGVLGREYGLLDKINVLRGVIDSFSLLYPQLRDLDLRRDADRLEVPIYLLDGRGELAARRDLALEWFEALDAPIKRRFAFDAAGHSVAFEQFEALHRILTDTIVPETYGRTP